MGELSLTWRVKIGYNALMFADMISFFWRITLVLLAWIFIWNRIQPKTQSMRILRAALVLFAMLAILAVTKAIGQ